MEILALYIPTMNFRDQMNAEINEADLWFKRAQKAVLASVSEWRDCGRCQGKGYAHFLGGDRAPGICFGCAGTGKLIKGRKEAQRVAAESKTIELNRLRFCWVAVNKAVKAQATDTTEREWQRAYTAKELIRIRDSYAVAGTAAAK